VQSVECRVQSAENTVMCTGCSIAYAKAVMPESEPEPSIMLRAQKAEVKINCKKEAVKERAQLWTNASVETWRCGDADKRTGLLSSPWHVCYSTLYTLVL